MQIYEALRRRGMHMLLGICFQTCLNGQCISTTCPNCLGTWARILRRDTWRHRSSNFFEQTGRFGQRSLKTMCQSGVMWRDCAHLMQPYLLPFTAQRLPSTSYHCPSQLTGQRMNGKGKQWGKDDEWKNKQWNKWQPYDPKKAKGKGKGGRTNMVPKVFKHKDPRIAWVLIIMAGDCALDTTWRSARKSQMAPNAILAGTFACVKDVMHLIQKRTRRRRSRKPKVTC